MQDDAELAKIGEEYASGRMLTGEIKKALIDVWSPTPKERIIYTLLCVPGRYSGDRCCYWSRCMVNPASRLRSYWYTTVATVHTGEIEWLLPQCSVRCVCRLELPRWFKIWCCPTKRGEQRLQTRMWLLSLAGKPENRRICLVASHHPHQGLKTFLLLELVNTTRRVMATHVCLGLLFTLDTNSQWPRVYSKMVNPSTSCLPKCIDCFAESRTTKYTNVRSNGRLIKIGVTGWQSWPFIPNDQIRPLHINI